MRLSEAMRKGAKVTSQTFGILWGSLFADSDGNTNNGSSCALGVALIGATPQLNHMYSTTCSMLWPWTETQKATCPDEKCKNMQENWPIANVVIHLNDHHRWTREEIADWLEKGENCMEAQHEVK